MGSCLYDKSYLNQISKMKAMPVKYNPDDFYRHPEFVPIKKEDVPVVAPVPEQAQNTNLVADYDDDEMGAFETAEFDEPPKIEEINGGDDPPETRETAGPGKITGPVRNASVSVNTSGMSMMARYKAEQAAVAAAAVVSAAKLLMAGHKNQATRQVSANHPRPPNLDPQALYINPDGMSNREPMAAEAIYSPSERNPPVSFYSARAAPDPQSGTIAGGQHHEQLFNPHSESPSLAKRWSSKIDHTKSGAIKREQATTDGGSHVTGQATVVEPVGGMSRPQLPADFISPHLDPNRMVGMPRGVVTPGRNASSFKPPGMLKRPLAEVSNGRANSMANLGADVGRLASKPPAEASDQSDPKRPKLVA